MIFPGVNLPDRAAHTGAVVPNDDEQIFGDKAKLLVRLDDLHMGEPLPIGAHFVLAFDDADPAVTKDSASLLACILVQSEHGFMVLLRGLVAGSVVAVVLLEGSVHRMRGTSRSVHVGRVEHHAINLAVAIGQVSTVGAGLDVSPEQDIPIIGNVTPEYAFAVSDVGDDAGSRDVQ